MAEWAGVRFGRVIDEAIHAATLGAAGGDAIEWDFAPLISIVPGQQPKVGYLLIISCRSMLLTARRISMCDTIDDSSPTDDQIRALTAGVVQSMYEARAAAANDPGAQGVN
jgi:hypothetical protein